MPTTNGQEYNGMQCILCGVLHENHPTWPTCSDHRYVTLTSPEVIESSVIIGEFIRSGNMEGLADYLGPDDATINSRAEAAVEHIRELQAQT